MNRPIAAGVPPIVLPPSAALVRTLPFRLVERLGAEILRMAGILVAQGLPGTGKSCAVAAWCRSLEVPVIWLHLADTAKGYEVLRALLVALGEDATGREPVLLARARECLAGRRLLLAVDEAHLLNREALRQIRYLYDQPEARFSIVLVGVDFRRAWDLAPEFESRVTRRVDFSELVGAPLSAALAAFSPVLAATDRDLLGRIDRECCRGNWRTWAIVLETAIDRGATAALGITPAVAASTLGSVPPTPSLRRALGRGQRR
jgi:hypothetical protein